MLIGVTGRGGSGKTTICKKIQEQNPEYIYIELDLVIQEKILKSDRLVSKINKIFNDRVYTINDIVMAYFRNDEISNHIHSFFLDEVEMVLFEIIDEKKSKNVIVDWFLLHKLKSFNDFDIKILTVLDKNERFRRVMKREKTKDINIFKMVDDCYDDKYNMVFDYIIDNTNLNCIDGIGLNERIKVH